MDHTTHRRAFLQQGFIRTTHIPYLLLALALLAVVYLWNGMQARNSAITQLEASKTAELAKADQQLQQYDVEINALKDNFQTLETENGKFKEQVVSLKREASHARAKLQRVQPLLDKRTALMDELEIQKVANGILAGKLKDVSQLKTDLSFARADNQRGLHVRSARDNLIGQLKTVKEENLQYMEQLSDLPTLKYQLSSANAANARLQHVAVARDNLMRDNAAMKDKHVQEIDLKDKTNLDIARRLQEIPKLKKELSFARAENQRAVYVSEARENLRRELLNLRQMGSQDSGGNAVSPALKNQLVQIREENDQLQRLSKSLDQAVVDALTGIQN